MIKVDYLKEKTTTTANEIQAVENRFEVKNL